MDHAKLGVFQRADSLHQWAMILSGRLCTAARLDEAIAVLTQGGAQDQRLAGSRGLDVAMRMLSRQSAAQSVHASLIHRFDFGYSCAANLCPCSGFGEFARFRDDLGEPVGEPVKESQQLRDAPFGNTRRNISSTC